MINQDPMDKIITGAQYEAIYQEGRLAAQRDYGLHGPTLKKGAETVTQNPYDTILEAAIWDAGYSQDGGLGDSNE